MNTLVFAGGAGGARASARAGVAFVAGTTSHRSAYRTYRAGVIRTRETGRCAHYCRVLAGSAIVARDRTGRDFVFSGGAIGARSTR